MDHDLAKELKDAGFPQEPLIQLVGYDGQYCGGFYSLIGKEVGEGGETYLTQLEYQAAVDRGDHVLKLPRLEEIVNLIGDIEEPHDTDLPTCWCTPRVTAHRRPADHDGIGEQSGLAILHNKIPSIYQLSLEWYCETGQWEATLELMSGLRLYRGKGEFPEEAAARLWLDLLPRSKEPPQATLLN